jgi:putative ABC transport system permease protein
MRYAREGEIMLQNYLKITLRNMAKQKPITFINIAGLAVGMACTILILLWVQNELSYDKFHQKANHIYRVIHERHFTDQVVHSAMTPPPLGTALTRDYPEIIDFTRYSKFVGRITLRYGEKVFYESDGAYADPGFFNIFSYTFQQGDPTTSLKDKNSIILSEELAKKYFGDENPMGKSLRLESNTVLTVTGILEKSPQETILPFDFLVPFTLMEEWGVDLNNWQGYPQYTYLLLQNNASMEQVNNKIADYLKKIEPENKDQFYLQPLTEIHLHSHFAHDYYIQPGDIRLVYIFSIIAIFILIIACINFINLTTARSLKRAKEIGIRRVMGGRGLHLFQQFMGESILFSLVAFIFAIMIVELFLPIFNRFSGKELNTLQWDFKYFLLLIGIITTTACFSGSYPALFLSSFQPLQVLRRFQDKTTGQSSRLRKGLVIFQFVLSIGLIICTFVLYSQLRFIQNKSLGFDKEHLIYIQAGAGPGRQYSLFKNELLRNSNILSVTATSNVTNAVPASSANVYWEGMDVEENQVWGFLFVHYDYFETMNIEIAEGRAFSQQFLTDSTEAFVINEEAAKLIGGQSVIGKRVVMGDRNGRIIGLAKNFHFNSLHQKINPLVIEIRPEFCVYILVKIRSEHIAMTMDYARDVWHRFAPDVPFEYYFLDETINRMYQLEIKMGKIFIAFTILAIFISCLGLFGLTSFMTEQRTKEIGVRKVLGATVTRICFLLSKEFTKCVLFANVIAWPLAWFIMNKWLQNFAYRVNIGLGIFLLAGGIALIVALLTVSYQSIKAAVANPINSIKYE